MPDEDNISMNMWMKGAPERKVFSALSPMTEGLSRIPDMPYAIKEQPTLTFVARQQGEAWNRPFVAVYEPSSVKEPGCISSVTFQKWKVVWLEVMSEFVSNKKRDVWTGLFLRMMQAICVKVEK